MNKVFPNLSNESSTVKQSTDIIMVEEFTLSHNCPNEIELRPHDMNQPHEHSMKQTKEANQLKDDNPRQMLTFVKFIKTSFYSNKKKPDVNMVNNKKSINTMKNNLHENNQTDNTNSDIVVPTFLRSATLNNDLSCRFCQEVEPENDLVTPCLCSGTMKYIHQSCLQRWIKTQDNRFCELCRYEFHMKVTTKPLKEWQRMEMSVIERRKVICSVTFHVIALTCVIWSLYVLIERAVDEWKEGRLDWPFWTKLIVIAIGFVGGIVFMYVQCRMYWSLCRKWYAFNRTFTIRSISSKERSSTQNRTRLKSEHCRNSANVPSIVSGDANHYFAQLAVSSTADINDHVNAQHTGPSHDPFSRNEASPRVHHSRTLGDSSSLH